MAPPTMPPVKTSVTDAMPCAPPMRHSGDEPSKSKVIPHAPREAQTGPTLKGRK